MDKIYEIQLPEDRNPPKKYEIHCLKIEFHEIHNVKKLWSPCECSGLATETPALMDQRTLCVESTPVLHFMSTELPSE